MAKVPLPIIVIAGLAAAGIVAAFLIRSNQGQLRACGHPRDLLEELNPFRATHCCTSGQTVSDLTALYYSQRIYHDDHGTYATSFDQLTNEFTLRPDGYAFYLESDGSRWSIVVPKQRTLAGSYLLTGDGKLHFCKSGTATTNDFVLRDLIK